VSFDLYFVPRPSDGRWDDALDELERAAADGAGLSSQDLELWARVVGAVTAVIPEAEEIDEVDGAAHRQLDDGVAIQVNMLPGALSITTPYWFEGRQAAAVVERLRQAADAIERVTDLVAYDPQAGAAFLDAGSARAVASFDSAAVALRDLGAKNRSSRAAPRWAFWRH
jgi:hypothetical protein